MGYNKLTKELLAAGYTQDNYPTDKVHIPGGCYSGDSKIDNIHGGFEYNVIYRDSFVYRTGCGMFVKGRSVIDNMGYMGEEWCHENDNPVIRCPFDKDRCRDNDSRLYGMLGGGLCIQCYCVCHRTEEAYDYGKSFERAETERQQEKERKYQEYARACNGRVCQRHMYYSERTREWTLRYEPQKCANLCYSKNGYCPILGKQLSKKRGNVYYDLKTSGIKQQRGNQISLFDGERWTHIRKGIRYFDHPCSMDICEAFVKMQTGEISEKYKWDHPMERIMDPSFQFEIVNIRAESRPSRDLAQDLADIKAGIDISFEPESEKERKQRKKEKMEAAKRKRIERLERKIITYGYENLEEYSLDRRHADKWLTPERIEELEEMRRQRIQEEKRKPVQFTLEDYMGGMEGLAHE